MSGEDEDKDGEARGECNHGGGASIRRLNDALWDWSQALVNNGDYDPERCQDPITRAIAGGTTRTSTVC